MIALFLCKLIDEIKKADQKWSCCKTLLFFIFLWLPLLLDSTHVFLQQRHFVNSSFKKCMFCIKQHRYTHHTLEIEQSTARNKRKKSKICNKQVTVCSVTCYGLSNMLVLIEHYILVVGKNMGTQTMYLGIVRPDQIVFYKPSGSGRIGLTRINSFPCV